MTRKKVDQGARMNEMERYAEKGHRSSTFSLMKQDPTSTPESISYAWEKAARAALQVDDMKFAFLPDASGTKTVRHELPPDYVDTVARDLRLTFKKFKLDPEDPWSWRMMATYMSLLFSAPHTKKGRPKTVTPEWLMQLEQTVRAKEFKNLTNDKVARKLANDKTSPFYIAGVDSRAGVEGLRKHVGKVRGKK
jgi:hypothetical protein